MQTETCFLLSQKFKSQACSLCKLKRSMSAPIQTPLVQQCTLPNAAWLHRSGWALLSSSFSSKNSCCIRHCPMSCFPSHHPADLLDDANWCILLLIFLVFEKGYDDHCNHFIRNSICGNKNVDKHFLSGSHFMSIFCHPRSWEIYFASRMFAYTERKKKKKTGKLWECCDLRKKIVALQRTYLT